MTAATEIERAGLLETARELARRELMPRAAELDAGDPLALAECWQELAGLGFDRALLVEQHGGAGLSVFDLLAAVEELAVGDGGIALCVLLSNAAHAAQPEKSAAIPAGERWVLVPVRSGTEVTISDGQLDGGIACALGAHGVDGLVLVGAWPTPIAVPAGTPGLRLQPDETQMGLRAAPAASISVTGIVADSDTTVSDGAKSLALLRAGTAAIARGIARRAYEMALEYAYARHQGGVAIIEYDAVSDMLAAMAVRLAVPLPANADEMQALAAKIAQTDAAVATTTDAVQVFGGIGYMRETGVEKLMRDAKYCQLFPEPNWVAHDELMRLERARRR